MAFARNSANRVILVGNVGQKPEVRYTSSGAAVANFSLATNEFWTDNDGNRQDRTEWHRIVTWRKQAEFCEQYVDKGTMLYIEGRLQTRDWEDKNGMKRYTTEVVADTITLLGGRGDTGETPKKQDDSTAPEPEDETDKYFGVVVVDDFCDEFGEIMWQNGESFNAHYSEIKKPEEYMPEHINTKFCWCEPELNFEDPETDSQVWVHRELQ